MNAAREQFRDRSRTELFFQFFEVCRVHICVFVPLGWMFGNWLLGELYKPNVQYLGDIEHHESTDINYDFDDAAL